MALSEDDLEPIGTDTGVDILTPDDAANQAFVRANLPRNFAAHFSHGMLGMTGFRLINAPTIVPNYIFMLTGSTFMVGLSQALQQAGSILSPLLSATAIEDKKRIMPYAGRTGMLMRVPLAGIALAGWLLSGWPLAIITTAFLFMLGYYSGAQRVAFQTLMAKVIPLSRRGRLQGYRNLAGGAIAAGLSWWAGDYLIDNNVFGNGYATTFALSFVLTSLGLTVLVLMMREPDSHDVRPSMRLRERMRDMPALLADTHYRNFLIAQLLTTGGRIALPFCILHAGEALTLDGKTLGLLSLAFLGADTGSNLLWGAMGDRRGFRSVFIASLLLWVIGYGWMLMAHDMAGFAIAFIFLGAASSGYTMGSQTMVLEFGNRENTAMRLAISTTAETIIASIGPIIGGILAAVTGFVSLIGVSATMLCLAYAVLILGVTDPRHLRRG